MASKIPLTPSTSPTLARPPVQSTTIGHFSALEFWDAISPSDLAVTFRFSEPAADGWADKNVDDTLGDDGR